MEWLNEALTALAAARAAHFIATALAAGVPVFRVAVAGPATASSPAVAGAVDAQTSRLAALGLGLTIVTGLIWFVLTAADISGVSASEALGSNVVRTLLLDTQFGTVAEVRITLAAILGICLVYDRFLTARWLAAVAAIAFIGALAWAGHAGAGLGIEADFHVAADALHLVGAGAWVGGLLPFALLLRRARRDGDRTWATVALKATRRFSTLGLASVAVLIVSGLINAWFLVGSLAALVVTLYGRLLVIKLTLFAAMLAFATINRFRLTPLLDIGPAGAAQATTLRTLTRNSVIEIVLGLLVFSIVGALGTLHPAIHFVE